MRILKVTQAYYPFEERGGPAVKVRSIARHLTQQGHKITVVTADLGFSPDQVTAAGASRIRGGWWAEPGGVEAVYLTTRFHYRNLTVNPGCKSSAGRGCRSLNLFTSTASMTFWGLLWRGIARRFKIPYFIEPLGMTRPIDRGFLWSRFGGDCLRATFPAQTRL